MTELSDRYPKVDGFLLRKWERVFNVFFDRNASHEVDWGDFYLVVRQVRDIYGADSTQMTYARKSLKCLWDGLCKVADKNKDELITIDEWIQLIEHSSKDKAPKWFTEYLGFMFKLFDVSDDGIMDLAEYTDGMHAYGYMGAECHAAFQKFSIDKKGKPLKGIKEDQWSELWHQYFYSTDPKAAGNNIFGIIPT